MSALGSERVCEETNTNDASNPVSVVIRGFEASSRCDRQRQTERDTAEQCGRVERGGETFSPFATRDPSRGSSSSCSSQQFLQPLQSRRRRRGNRGTGRRRMPHVRVVDQTKHGVGQVCEDGRTERQVSIIRRIVHDAEPFETDDRNSSEQAAVCEPVISTGCGSASSMRLERVLLEAYPVSAVGRARPCTPSITSARPART